MKAKALSIFTSFCFLISMVTSTYAQLSGNYTIANPGGDYTTFSAAIADLVAQGVSGPVTFDVQSGIYTEQLTIPPISGASAINRITFQGDENDNTAVLLTFTPSLAIRYVVQFNGADFITFRKMNIQATVLSRTQVIHLTNGADDIRILDNRIEGPAFIFGQLIFQAHGSPCHNLIISNNEFLNGGTGINLANPVAQPSATGVIIEGNIMNGQQGYGIAFGNEEGIKILNNIINDPVLSGIRAASVNNNNGGANRSLIANNMIYKSALSTSSSIILDAAKYIDVYHNSVSGGRSPVLRIVHCIGINVVNNILATNGTGSTLLISGNPNAVQVSDFNDYYAPNAGPQGVINWLGAVINDIPTLQAINGMDANSVSIDPMFASASDLHLSLASPAVLASGTSLIGIVPEDIDGDPRNPISPTMGADEFAGGGCPPFTANAGSDATICEGSTHGLSGIVGGGAASSLWTTLGSGSFDDPALLSPVYTPSAIDIGAGTVTLILTTNDPDGAGPCLAVSDNMVLTINAAATTNAGLDDAICEGDTYILSGAIGGSATSSTWSTVGDGGFDDFTLPAATYTLGIGDILAGSVTLTLITDDPDGLGPCVSAVDGMVLTISPPATASAGADATVCEGSTHTLAGAIGGSATSSTWTTSGTGAFDNAALLAATYTPSPTDILTGSVTLTLTTDDPAGPCTAAVDAMTLTIDPVATANAGADVTICEGSTHTLAGVIGGGASSSTWSTSGTGGFDNAALLAATYTPSAIDLLAGSVTLTLTTDDPAGPCTAAVDAMILTIDPVATANAGADATICEGSTHTPAGVIGGSATSSTWSTSGTGGFDNAALVTATYTPSAADILTGSVTLTLTTDDPIGPCISAMDAMILTIETAPTVDAGFDKVVVISPTDPTPPSPTPCVTLTATTVGGTPPYTYAWSPVMGLTTPTSVSTQACPTITTLYTVTVTDANGCIGTDQVLVTVVITTDVCTDLSKTDLAITNSVSNPSPNVGEPFSYTITASNYGPNNVDYVYIKDAFDSKIWCGTWSLSVSSPPGTTVQFNCGADLPCFSGGQISSIDAVNACVDPICANTDEVCLEITDLPAGEIVTFTISGVEVCSAVSCSTVVDNKAERICVVPDDCISTNDDPNAPIVVNPTCAKLSGPTDDDSGTTTDLMDLEMQNILTIFPNPNSGEFTLIMLGKNKQIKTSIYLYNALGEIVYESESVNHHFISIDISSYSKGVYFVKVIQGDHIYRDKIIYQ